MAELDDIGAVIIGRNEGERLKRCISSFDKLLTKLVYVDSSSTDGSAEYADEIGVSVVNLDTSIPFSAGRARNEGFQKLVSEYPSINYVQFVDGDCELAANWLSDALGAFDQNSQTAIVCGRRREKAPNASIYNQICDIEWNTPIGDARSCGGDFLARCDAFRSMNGFDPSVVAGEEPELCFRLRRDGWKISRIDAQMTFHDANLHKFGEWWQRSKRCGHAYAQGMDLHGSSAEKFNVRQVKSSLFWGAALPLVFIFTLLVGWWQAAIFFLIMPLLLYAKTARYFMQERLLQKNMALVYSAFVVVGKLPEAIGVCRFYLRKFRKAKFEIIEYK